MSRSGVTSGVRQSELARIWGVSRQTVSRYRKEGMPLDSVEAAAAWRLAVKGKGDGGGSNVRDNNCSATEKSVPEVAIAEEGLRGLVERTRTTERMIWVALESALQGEGNHEAKRQLLRQHKEAAATLVKVETECAELDVRLGRLVEMEDAKGVVRAALSPLLVAMRALAGKVSVKANPARPEIAEKAIAGEIERVLILVQEGLK